MFGNRECGKVLAKLAGIKTSKTKGVIVPTNFRVELGSRVKSNITGFCGIATARSEHINSCHRYWVQPPVDKDGKYADGCWFDDGELEVLEMPVVQRTSQDNGGFPSKIK